MSQEGGSNLGSGGPVVVVGRRQGLKKGPWTAAEDSILMEYVRKHGEGNWNAVQRNSGLMRCGKSCRLRWANHLRPNLKKGAITSEEERLIIELHAKFGNKWARMAAQLPGRTDNEIKNYWNTRVKRRQRAGLPIYPREAHHQHHQHQNYHHQNHLQQTPPISSPSTLSSLLPPPQRSSHSQNPSYNPSGSLFDVTNFQPPTQNPNSSYLPDPNHYFKLLRDNTGGLALSLSSSPPTLNHQGLITADFFCKHSQQFNSLNFGTNQSAIIGAETELHSIQTTGLETTQHSYGLNNNAGGEYMVALSNDTNDYEIGPDLLRRNNGLLGDLLEESEALTRVHDRSKNDKSLVGETDKGKSATGDGLTLDLSAAHSSAGTKAKDGTEEMNIMDDDLLSLLDFQMTVPVPDWYNGSGDVSNEQSTNVTNGNVGMDNQQASPRPSIENASVPVSHDWNAGACCWNNMPSIY